MTTIEHSPAHRLRGPRHGGRRRQWWLAALVAAGLATLVYSLYPYLPPDPTTSRVPPSSGTHYVLLVAHIFTAAVALAAGLAQFWPWLRSRHPVVHRWVGRAYFFLGVFPSAVIGIPVTVLAPVGLGNQSALAALDVLWLATGIAGYRAARQRRFADHRRWMVRNYALTLVRTSSTVLLPVVVVLALADPGYANDPMLLVHDTASAAAWLGLLVNLVAAEWLLARKKVSARRARAASG